MSKSRWSLGKPFSGEQVKCDRCGAKLAKGHLGRHQNSLKCKVDTTLRELKDTGWVNIHTMTDKPHLLDRILHVSGVPVREEVESLFLDGVRANASYTKNMAKFVPAWVALCLKWYLNNLNLNEPVTHMQVLEGKCFAALSLLKEDEELRKIELMEYLLQGHKRLKTAAVNYLKANKTG
jgi:hypothetical protein